MEYQRRSLSLQTPPYNLGVNAYASNPSWYIDGDNKKGESDKAGREFFDTDKDFRPALSLSPFLLSPSMYQDGLLA